MQTQYHPFSLLGRLPSWFTLSWSRPMRNHRIIDLFRFIFLVQFVAQIVEGMACHLLYPGLNLVIWFPLQVIKVELVVLIQEMKIFSQFIRIAKSQGVDVGMIRCYRIYYYIYTDFYRKKNEPHFDKHFTMSKVKIAKGKTFGYKPFCISFLFSRIIR